MPKIYFFPANEVEVHNFGEYVSVVWQTVESEEEVPIRGRTRRVTIQERIGEPYIDFVTVEEGDDGHPDLTEWENGGLTPEQALKLARELTEAAEYMRKLETEKSL